jgi:hypothetical protein
VATAASDSEEDLETFSELDFDSDFSDTISGIFCLWLYVGCLTFVIRPHVVDESSEGGRPASDEESETADEMEPVVDKRKMQAKSTAKLPVAKKTGVHSRNSVASMNSSTASFLDLDASVNDSSIPAEESSVGRSLGSDSTLNDNKTTHLDSDTSDDVVDINMDRRRSTILPGRPSAPASSRSAAQQLDTDSSHGELSAIEKTRGRRSMGSADSVRDGAQGRADAVLEELPDRRESRRDTLDLNGDVEYSPMDIGNEDIGGNLSFDGADLSPIADSPQDKQNLRGKRASSANERRVSFGADVIHDLPDGADEEFDVPLRRSSSGSRRRSGEKTGHRRTSNKSNRDSGSGFAGESLEDEEV